MTTTLQLAALCCLLFPSLAAAFLLRSTRSRVLRPSGMYMSSSSSLADKIRSAVQAKYNSNGEVGRVVECWDNFNRGAKLNRYVDADGGREIHQTADCFVSGLTAKPFHDVSKFDWVLGLQKHHGEILQELRAYEAKEAARLDEHWLGPRDTSGTHYGPEWKTLALQDRSVWDEERIQDFPLTVGAMQRLCVPSCEAFFAKQGARSGIKPHSDKNNFIITCHVALDVPEGECWIRVGDQTHYWKNGQSCIFDTSITHSTENTSDRTRYVLLLRFWHPELAQIEVDAFKFIFDYLDHSAYGEEALEHFEMQHLLMGKDNHRGLGYSADSGATSSSSSKSKGIGSKNRKEEQVKSKAAAPSKGFGKKGGGGREEQ